LPPPVKKFFPFHLGSSWQLDFDFSSVARAGDLGFPDRFLLAALALRAAYPTHFPALISL
jgi:hypothetical protein